MLFFAISLMMVIIAIFKIHPAVEYGRVVVPEEVYVGKECDCHCILDARPWYSKVNYWFYFFLIIIPLLVFSVRPDSQKWKRSLRTIACIGLGYISANLAVHLMWDIRNGPFWVVSGFSSQKSWDIPNCANVADGASIAFVLLLGWIYAAIYAGWWDMIWYQYHKRRSKTLSENFKRDAISLFCVSVSVVIPLILAVVIVISFFEHYVPEHVKAMIASIA